MKIIKITLTLILCAAFFACAGAQKKPEAGPRPEAGPKPALAVDAAAPADREEAVSADDYKKQGHELSRNYPVLLTGGKTSAALKLNIKYPGNNFNGVLTINKAGAGDFKIKLLADFATVVIDGDFIEGKMEYKYVLGNMFEQKALDAFADIMTALLLPPGEFIRASAYEGGQTRINYRRGDWLNRYYFKKGLGFPYKMEQIKTIVRKKFSFNDYEVYGDTSLPARIVVEDTHSLVTITLELINVK